MKTSVPPAPFNALNLPYLANLAQNLTLRGLESYLTAYPVFIDYFQSISTIASTNLIIGSHFAYGWMPTILTLGSGDIPQACTLLNRAKDGHRLTKLELEQLQRLINNSVVGLSKLLHFVGPELYPIWDSNVACFVTGEIYPYHKMKQVQNYLHFIGLCDEVIANPAYEQIHQLLANKLEGQPVSRFRTLDLILFTAGSKLLSELEKKAKEKKANKALERVGELIKVESRANFVVAKLQSYDQTMEATDRPSMGRNFAFFQS